MKSIRYRSTFRSLLEQVSRMEEAIEANVFALDRLLTTEAYVARQFRDLIAVTGITQHRHRHCTIGVRVWLPFEEVNRGVVAGSVGHKEVPFPSIKNDVT